MSKKIKEFSSPLRKLKKELRLAKSLEKTLHREFNEKRKELKGCLSEVKELTILNEGMLNSSFVIRFERVQGEVLLITKRLLVQSRKVDRLKIDIIAKKWEISI
jgi:hypothetical protein